MNRGLPAIVDATVYAQDPDNYRVLVSIDAFGGQILFVAADVLTHGPRDAVRGDYPPLPTPGTRGLVAFTRGDDRTGRWIGSQAPSLPDASTLAPGAGNARYTAEWSGAFRLHQQSGADALAWPDGSTAFMAPSGAAFPAPTRHTVDATGARVRTPFTTAERVPAGSPAFGFAWTFANGAVLSVSAAGDVSATAAAGRTATVAVASGASATINPDGSITLAPANGKNVLVPVGDVIADAGGGNFVSLLDHTHQDPQGGTTSSPNPGT